MNPTLHVTNWSSRKLHGPGRRWTIMALPRRWELGEGRVEHLTPRVEDLDAVRNGRIDIAEYHRRFLEHVLAYLLACGEQWGETAHLGCDVSVGLFAVVDEDGNTAMVQDGDTLCCACSRAAAAAGKCHRVWSARLLVQAGWHVLLDGVEVQL